MDIYNVIAFGDSFLEGAEIVNTFPDLEYVAPALLAKDLNVPFYNYAKSGVGILAVTKQILNAKIEGKLKNNSFVVISLPPVGRFDFFTKDEIFTIDYPYHHKIITNEFNNPINKSLEMDDGFQMYQKFYQSIGNKIDMIETGDILHILGMFAINTLVNVNNKFIFCGWPPRLQNKEYQSIVEDILTNLHCNFISDGFVGWSKKNNYFIHKYGHPGRIAHINLKKIIHKKIIN